MLSFHPKWRTCIRTQGDTRQNALNVAVSLAQRSSRLMVFHSSRTLSFKNSSHLLDGPIRSTEQHKWIVIICALCGWQAMFAKYMLLSPIMSILLNFLDYRCHNRIQLRRLSQIQMNCDRGCWKIPYFLNSSQHMEAIPTYPLFNSFWTA